MRDPLCPECKKLTAGACVTHADIFPPGWYDANAFLPPRPPLDAVLLRLCADDKEQLNRIEEKVDGIEMTLARMEARQMGLKGHHISFEGGSGPLPFTMVNSRRI